MANPLSGLLGDGSIGRQLLVWGFLNQLIGQVSLPVTTQLMDEVWPRLPSMPLSPAEVADMVIKGILDAEAGAAEAATTGVNGERFARMVRNTGEPISPRDALEALRRGVIGEDNGAGGGPSYMEAVRQSRLRNEWAPVLAALQWLPLPPSDAVDAVVEGQIDYAEGEAQAKLSGVKPEEFRVLVNTRGRPPSPTELAELLRRGHIPLQGTGPDAVSFQQGIFEGATKDKWWEEFAKLAEYLPPPRTVTALLHEGAISKDQAATLFKQSGLSDQLAAAYVASASHQRLAKARELTLATVMELYTARAITVKDATSMIEHLGYDEHEAAYLLELHDLQRELKVVNAVVTRVGSLYVARKLTSKDVAEALSVVHIPDTQVAELIAAWNVERNATVRVLSEGQVTSAVYYDIITPEQGIAYLVEMGYSEYDAWVAISVRMHGAQGKPPAAGANVTGRAQ